ncbi:hypothetical protein ACQP2C_26020 [Micromonospora zamorensis]|uniref:hypothetical protein n=1 Tax=Micromonospora zamorensis TaxID=709883 RepID=UPI003D95A914
MTGTIPSLPVVAVVEWGRIAFNETDFSGSPASFLAGHRGMPAAAAAVASSPNFRELFRQVLGAGGRLIRQ